MNPFVQLTSRVIPLAMDNVDTDMIIPAQFLTKINRDGYGAHVFQRLREQNADFIFNTMHGQSAEILLTQSNFGCGSSREHAVWALMQSGIKVIIAASYSDIFQNNAEKNGLLTICLPSLDILALMKSAADKNLSLTVDLSSQRITTSQSEHFVFAYDPFRKACFMKGQDDFDYLLEATA